MDQNNGSNFNVVTTTKSDKKTKNGLIIGAVVVLFLAISIPAGVYLVKQQQDIREKAEEALLCPAAEACPVAGDPTLLRSCYSLNDGQAPVDISCSTIANVGTTTVCGGVSYCCPSLGASWTTNLTLCAEPSPTATPLATETPQATASATPTATASAQATATASSTIVSATATATATPTASSSATLMPIPATGTDWPTFAGVGIGILVIIGSILLVL